MRPWRSARASSIEPEYRCGECEYCRSGRYNLCRWMGFIGLMGDGAMAESVVVPSYTVHALPDEVQLRAGRRVRARGGGAARRATQHARTG